MDALTGLYGEVVPVEATPLAGVLDRPLLLLPYGPRCGDTPERSPELISAEPAKLFAFEPVAVLVEGAVKPLVEPLSARLLVEPEEPYGAEVVEGFVAARGAVFELELAWNGFFHGDQVDAVEPPLLQPARLATINNTSVQCADEIRMVVSFENGREWACSAVDLPVNLVRRRPLP